MRAFKELHLLMGDKSAMVEWLGAYHYSEHLTSLSFTPNERKISKAMIRTHQPGFLNPQRTGKMSISKGTKR